MTARCGLDAGCDAVATARVAIARRPTGGVAYLTAVPIALASAAGGIATCADHLHGQIDSMLMTALGPTTPPARETAADPDTTP